MGDIHSILDARLPQPCEWDQLPRKLRTRLEKLSQRRSQCPDEEIGAIDQEMIGLLLPHAREAQAE